MGPNASNPRLTRWEWGNVGQITHVTEHLGEIRKREFRRMLVVSMVAHSAMLLLAMVEFQTSDVLLPGVVSVELVSLPGAVAVPAPQPKAAPPKPEPKPEPIPEPEPPPPPKPVAKKVVLPEKTRTPKPKPKKSPRLHRDSRIATWMENYVSSKSRACQVEGKDIAKQWKPWVCARLVRPWKKMTHLKFVA